MFKHFNIKRSIIYVSLLMFISLTFLSLFYVINAHDHDCNHKDCVVCESIEALKKYTNNLVPLINTIVITIVTYYLIKKISYIFNIHILNTQIKQKIRLNI